MKWYKMYPSLFASPSFVITSSDQWEILHRKFCWLKDAVEFAKETRVALREENWYVYEITWSGLMKKRISLKILADWGLISQEQTNDGCGSPYYHWK